MSCDVLVPIQGNGAALPIFAVPGAGGNVLSLYALSRALGDQQPLYGLQAVGLDGRTAPLASVEETAKTNLAALKRVQAVGPYRLIGHSYGGVVAYEMARALQEQGEEVVSLVLLDSLAPAVWQERLASDEASLLGELCRTMASLNGIELTVDSERLKSVSPDERARYIAAAFTEHGVELGAAQFATLYEVFKANELCYRNYRPRPLSSEIDISLLRATQRPANARHLPEEYGWSELLRGPVRIYDVNASHFAMLEAKYAAQIAKVLDVEPAQSARLRAEGERDALPFPPSVPVCSALIPISGSQYGLSSAWRWRKDPEKGP